MIPETADGYALNVPENLAGVINAEALKSDPMIAAVREHFKATGRTQGEFDQLFDTLGTLEAKGFIPKPLDFAAERAALGSNGEARQKEVSTFANALKARGEITDAEYGELMSLAPTAAGVTLIEKLRKMTGDATIKPPGETTADPKAQAQAEARAMAKDPKYGKDRAFTAAADKAYREAFS